MERKAVWKIFILVVMGLFLTGTYALTVNATGLGAYSVTKSKIGDPWTVDVSKMTKLSSLTTTTWNKVNLPSPCVDGSGASTFIMANRGSVNNLLILLEWGGACYDYDSCQSALSGGSVITLNPSYSTLSVTYTAGIWNNSNSNNPFRNWNKVLVPFGTGDIHMGNGVTKYTSSLGLTSTVYHSGFLNAVVAMRWAKAQKTFDKVVLAGSSAGGFGTTIHSYSMYQIFNKPIYTVNDSGPALKAKAGSKTDDNLDLGNRWGAWQNYPADCFTDKSKALLTVAEYGLSKCTNCYYGLFETLQDSTIRNFEGYTGAEFQAELLKTVKDVNSRWDSRFGYYLVSGTAHTILSSASFYTTRLSSTYLYTWVKNLINGSVTDLTAAN